MRLELHCHSTCSDGSLAPAEVASAAADRGAGQELLLRVDVVPGG